MRAFSLLKISINTSNWRTIMKFNEYVQNLLESADLTEARRIDKESKKPDSNIESDVDYTGKKRYLLNQRDKYFTRHTYFSKDVNPKQGYAELAKDMETAAEKILEISKKRPTVYKLIKTLGTTDQSIKFDNFETYKFLAKYTFSDLDSLLNSILETFAKLYENFHELPSKTFHTKMQRLYDILNGFRDDGFEEDDFYTRNEKLDNRKIAEINKLINSAIIENYETLKSTIKKELDDGGVKNIEVLTNVCVKLIKLLNNILNAYKLKMIEIEIMGNK
jgi:hypothetical protein